MIPRVVANGRAIYRGKISWPRREARIAAYWRPWHDRLQALLDETRELHGEAILIDCHSMPHEAMESFAQAGPPGPMS